MKRAIALTSAACLAITAGSMAYAQGGQKSHRIASEFQFATIYVEQNATDVDTEIVITAKPDSDLGLKWFVVRDPNHRKVVQTRSPRRVEGMREFLFESPEPAGSGILAKYPEGTYTFRGRDTNGQLFYAEAELAHALPQATDILAPIDEAVVTLGPLVIEWTASPDAAQYLLEFENESLEPEQALTINLPAEVTQVEIPSELIIPASDYQISIAVIGENNNISVTESTFSTD